VVGEIAASGGLALEIHADIADQSSVERMLDTLEDRFGPVLAGYISDAVTTIDGGFTAGLGTGGRYGGQRTTMTSADA
jgi:hypothetical protein